MEIRLVVGEYRDESTERVISFARVEEFDLEERGENREAALYWLGTAILALAEEGALKYSGRNAWEVSHRVLKAEREGRLIDLMFDSITREEPLESDDSLPEAA